MSELRDVCGLSRLLGGMNFSALAPSDSEMPCEGNNYDAVYTMVQSVHHRPDI